MKKIFVTLFFILFLSINNAHADSFPMRCEGKWSGMMQIWAQGSLIDSVQVIFNVQRIENKPGCWIWKTEYVSEKMPVTKDYTLYQKSGSINEYIVDEGDGVLLTQYVFGNKMYSLFKVEKIWLTSSYELKGENLIFEVTSGSAVKEKTKGIRNYSIDFMQRVVLTRLE